MKYVHSPLTLPLLYFVMATFWPVVILYKSKFVGRWASSYVDRVGIRPSTIEAMFTAPLGISQLAFLFALPSPILLFHFVIGLSGCFAIACAAELFRTPVNQQIRPAWYVGAGKPEWRTLASGAVRRLQFSAFSIAVFVTAVCIAVGIGVPRWKSYKTADNARIKTTNLVADLGGRIVQQNVVLARTAATDEHIKELVHLGPIRHLNLNLTGTSISNDGLRHFARLADIRILKLSSTRTDDAGLEPLQKAVNLEMLVLRKTKVTGTGLRQEWIHLKNLDLSECPVTREGIERTALYPELAVLSLQGTDIDDSMVETLAKLSTKFLDISGTRITSEGVAKLKGLALDIETIRWFEAPPAPPGILHGPGALDRN